MADSKITALASIGTGTDPANDPLVIVDVSDILPGGMSLTGTTKKVTLNNLLACSPTATLASATITGDLTVRSGNKLKLFRSDNAISTDFSDGGSGVGTIINNLNVDGFRLRLGGNNVYNVAGDGTYTQTWFNGGGGTWMTLNSTGLGVGVSSPSFNIHARGTTDGRIQVEGASGYGMVFIQASSGNTAQLQLNSSGGSGRRYVVASNSSGQFLIGDETAVATRLTIDSTGNCGIAVTPSAWNNSYNVIEIGQNGSISGRTSTNNAVDIVSNGFRNAGGTWVYKLATSNAAARYLVDGSVGAHFWYSGATGTANNTIAGFSTPIMTLDANGNLILLSSNTPATLATNGQLTVNATSNTNLRFSYRGSDGVTRVANITLA
jgi:hypothetical protein